MSQLLHDQPTTTQNTSVVVEARTAEEALEQVHRTHGEDARILQAEKVRKGGVGGFFTRELVQLTVEPAPTPGRRAADGAAARPPAAADAPMAPPATARPPVDAPAPVGGPAPDEPVDEHADETLAELLDRRMGHPGGLSGVVAELAAATDHRESTFGDALRSALDVPDTATPRDVPTTVESPTPARDRVLTGAGAPARAPTSAPSSAPESAPAWSRVDHPRFASGATALARVADRVAVPPPAEQDVPRGPAIPADVDREEARFDAALRAVNAGTTAGSVVRAAEAGGVTRFSPPDLGAPRLAAQPAAAPAAQPAADPAAQPAATSSAAVAVGPWSEDRLTRLGVPAVLVRTIVGQRPSDDLGWLTATTRAVTPVVGVAPEGPAVVVGGRVKRYATAAQLTVCTLSAAAPRRGTIALTCRPTERALRWLDRERRQRWLHLVIGGSSWRDWLFQAPDAVSWSEPADLPEALSVATRLDLPLVTSIGDDGEVRDATALDVAIALRDLLGQW